MDERAPSDNDGDAPAVDEAASPEENTPQVEEPSDEAVEAAVEELRGLVTYLAKALTDDQEAVEVDAQRRGSSVHLSLRLSEDELGKVIGRQGRIARAIRTVVSLSAARHNLRASLDIEG